MKKPDTRIPYSEIEAYCINCQKFLKESDISAHLTHSNPQVAKKDENDPFWQRMKNEQKSRIIFE